MTALSHETPVILFASGKGGVGKSTLSVALSLLLAREGRRVLLIDGDVGLRNLDLMLGMQDKVLFELADCLHRQCSLDEAILQAPAAKGLHLLVAGQEAKPRVFSGQDLERVFRTLKQRFDVILIDGPAGLGRVLRNWTQHANRVVLVATGDDVCLRDTEKTERLMRDNANLRPQLLLNRVDERLVRRGLVPAAKDIALALDMELLGVIPESGKVYQAMIRGSTALDAGDTAMTLALQQTATRLLGVLPPWRDPKLTVWQKLKKFWEEG